MRFADSAHRRRHWQRGLLAALLLGGGWPAAGQYQPGAAAKWRGVTAREIWTDESGNREVPVKIYRPDTTAPEDGFPAIVFSHGLGGSREGYHYLGSYWAAHGYLVVHPQHVGSDDSMWKHVPIRERMAAFKRAANGANAIQRMVDVRIVVDRLVRDAKRGGKDALPVNAQRIGMGGHSFGSRTTLMAVGEAAGRSDRRRGLTLGDERIRAAVLLSPAPPSRGDPKKAFEQVTVPCLHLTGTLDDSPISNMKPAERRIPFDSVSAGHHYLVIFTNADHMVFSGRRTALGRREVPFERVTKSTQQITLAFWDAFLRDDAEARKWLDQGGLERYVGTAGRFEQKHP